MTFEELGVIAPLREAVEKLGFEQPMPIQEEVIPYLLGEGRDIIALAQTGTGKTAAFGLPLLQNLVSEEKYPQALILAPTRELCMQITKDIAQFAVHMREVSLVAVYGGASIEEQIRQIRRGVQIVVATPGRLLDLIRRGAIEMGRIKDVVLDEADEMLNMGFSEDLDKILASIPKDRHLLLFSATMFNEMRKITKKYLKNPTEVQIGERNVINANIQHIYYMVASKDKYLALKRIADYYPSIYGIVFCKTKKNTQEVAQQLIEDGYSADALHGDLSQAQRDQVMQRFRVGMVQLLVATDVAARGLDVDSLTHVIHFGLPAEVESYTHRSGRTARAGKSGISISICHLREKGLVRNIEKKTGITFEKATLPTAEEICEKQLNQFITKLEHTVPEEEMIAPYMDAIYKRFSWLDKEELLQRLVYTELKRLLDYYDNAAPLSEPSEKAERGGEKQLARQRGSRGPEKGFAQLQLNFGRRDRLFPNVLIDMINQALDQRVDVGKIQIQDRFTTFEVPTHVADLVQDSMAEYEFKGRKILVTRVTSQRRDYNRSKGGGGHRKGNNNRSSRR